MKKGTTGKTPPQDEGAGLGEEGVAPSQEQHAEGKKSSKRAESKQIAALEHELGEKAQEMEAIKGRMLRLQADFDNFRKRVVREKEELRQRAHAELIEDVLPVIDHMELALNAAGAHESPGAFVEGFRLVLDQIVTVLTKYALTPIHCGGAEFDPNLHEAIVHTPSCDVPENHVIQQTRRGYMLGDRLLRAAQVVVSSGPADQVAGADVTTGGGADTEKGEE